MNYLITLLSTILISINIYALDVKFHSIQANLYEPKEEVIKIDEHSQKILINFWATWCTSCIEELPLLEKLKKDPKASQYQFYGISSGDTDKKIAKFIRRNGYPYQVIPDRDKTISKNWNVKSLPITIIIEKGKIIFSGIRPPESLL